MAAFVNICFTDEGAAFVSGLQKILADEGVTNYAARLGYPPHVTLVRCDDAEPDALIPVAERFIGQFASIRLWLGGLSLFGGPKPVLWLAPVPNVALLDIQRRLCTELKPLAVHEHYRPKNWTPHVTLAAGLSPDDAIAAISVLLPLFEPMLVTPSRIEVVTFPPAKVVWSRCLVP